MTQAALETNLQNLKTMEAELEDYYAADPKFVEYKERKDRDHPLLKSHRVRNREAINLAEKMVEVANDEQSKEADGKDE